MQPDVSGAKRPQNTPSTHHNTVSATKLQRSNHGLLAAFEQPVLIWIASRLPHWFTPDRLTGIGVLGVIMSFIGYAGSIHAPWLLWIASLGLIVNWFGDSLDGTVARYRRIERPRYGFYLDNAIDVVQQLLFVLGVGLSGIVRMELILLGLAAFYAMSILTLIRAQIFGQFPIAYGGFGPTELRVVFILLNLAVLLVPPRPFEVAGFSMSYPDVLSIIWSVMTILTFLLVMIRDVRILAAEDPPKTARMS